MEPVQLSSNWRKLQATLGQESRKTEKRTLINKSLKRKQTARSEHETGTVKKARTSPRSSISHKPDNMIQSTSTLRRSKSIIGSRPKPDSNTTASDKNSSRPSTSHGVHKAVVNTVRVNEGVSPTALAGRYIALDCEMVGFGSNPDDSSQLARVSLVNYHGEQLYDSYVLPQLPVTDYRTPVSGVRPKDLKAGVARSFKEVQADVDVFLKGRILIGHALRNDMSVLLLSHPRRDTRDTARHPKFRDMNGGKAPALRRLAKDLLGIEIQSGEHSSVEDARVCMLLYRQEKDGFEAENTKHFGRINDDRVSGASGSRKKTQRRKR